MASRDVSDGKGHGENRQPESKRHTEEADSQSGEGRCQHRRAASPKYEPEGSEEFRRRTFSQSQGCTSRIELGLRRFGFYPSPAPAEAIKCYRSTPEKYQCEGNRRHAEWE